MSQMSAFGGIPGLGAAVETFEQAITWGTVYRGAWLSGLIAAAAVDSGNSPTWRLRPGLLMGQIAASGQWTNYSPTATDGSEVAAGIIAYGLRMQDVFSGSNVQKYQPILVGGLLIGSNIIGLDLMARAQLRCQFLFDDNIVNPGDWFPYKRFQSKTADYTIVASDNGSVFDNTGAIGTVVLTLPPIANGYIFGFRGTAAQALQVNSAEGTNMVVYGNASLSSVAFSTGGQIIGGGLNVYSNPAGTKWIVENTSAGANTVSAA